MSSFCYTKINRCSVRILTTTKMSIAQNSTPNKKPCHRHCIKFEKRRQYSRHTPADTLDVINPQILAETVDMAEAYIREIAG